MTFSLHIKKALDWVGVRKNDISGAVTVDWVVLTAALVAIGFIVWSIVRGGIVEGASDIRAALLTAARDI